MTIVLFSRCFYDANDKSDFPVAMRDCLQVGFDNKFYEDFYHVIVQARVVSDPPSSAY